MIPLSIDPALTANCPDLRLGLIACRVRNSPSNAELWRDIDGLVDELRRTLTLETANKQPEIAATREAYRRCGKDPNRYRPSAEALRRRVVQGKGLYRVNTLVDLTNMVSLRTGCSINGFDADRIEGAVRWGIARADEPYEGIGRGPLNIEGLPVVRDELGAIGTPTSDSVRTMLTADTRRFLMNINSYSGRAHAAAATELACTLLRRCAAAEERETALIV